MIQAFEKVSGKKVIYSFEIISLFVFSTWKNSICKFFYHEEKYGATMRPHPSLVKSNQV